MAATSRRARSRSTARAGSTGRTEPTQTQRRLLAAALELFAARGFDGASTAEIAARAGVAEKTLFANFGTKEGLYQATLGPATLDVLLVSEAIRTVLPVFECPPPELAELLHAVVANRVGFATEHPRELRLTAQHFLARPADARAALAKFRASVAPLIEGVVRPTIARGALRDDVPLPAMLRMIVGQVLCYALARAVFMPDAKWDDAREIRQIVSVLVEGLAPRAPARGTRTRPTRRRRASRAGRRS